MVVQSSRDHVILISTQTLEDRETVRAGLSETEPVTLKGCDRMP